MAVDVYGVVAEEPGDGFCQYFSGGDWWDECHEWPEALLSDLNQLVEFGGGQAAINPDGSATVDWDGSFSINFYDGLVPFTITNPHLEVSAAGTGVLTADLTGYEVEMSNPNEKPAD